MNLIDKLMEADPSKLMERKTKKLKSDRLTELTGSMDPVEITIQSIPKRRLNQLLSIQMDKKGNYNFERSIDAQLMVIVEGMKEPDMKNKDLQTHFGAQTPKDLAERLFDTEITKISDEIMGLCGMDDDEDTEDAIKN
jgi:hypothetical protein